MREKIGHIVGAAVGLVAAGALWYLLMRSAQDFSHIAVFDVPGPAFPAAGGSIQAAAALVGAAVIAGVLAASSRLSPVAPLVAGLALTGYGLLWFFDSMQARLTLTSHLPGLLMFGANDLLPSGMFQVLGGALLTSAALPWRWRRAPFPGSREPLGLLLGMVGVPALWYLIQLASPVGSIYVQLSAHLPRNMYLWLVPQLALAIVLGVLAAARPAPPVMAVIIGLPLVAAGLDLTLAPVDTSQAVAHLILGFQSLSTSIDEGQSVMLGAYLLFGGMLVVSAAFPWRWRKPGSAPEADPGPATDVVPEATAS